MYRMLRRAWTGLSQLEGFECADLLGCCVQQGECLLDGLPGSGWVAIQCEDTVTLQLSQSIAELTYFGVDPSSCVFHDLSPVLIRLS